MPLVSLADSAGRHSGNQTINHGQIIRSDIITIVIVITIVITIETTKGILDTKTIYIIGNNIYKFKYTKGKIIEGTL